ncbi:MAG: chemotaxis response regulator protein-glutamate methylesterase [Firmicutes bacterium]|nr:chemotaxis response regulator protein-glutamate methylesterase [Dethiobacter sp.]MBS3888622.1 chemotaxis response regulator protein-glutamate methylesterase [Bacillota bacterium]
MSNEKKVRVLVVDDSPFMRQLIGNIIGGSADLEVVGIARDGKEAVEKCRDLRPDVLTLDIEMPVMTGLEALAVIMRETPTPVVMVSSLTKAGAKETLQALEIGAIDFIAKPERAANTFDLAATILPKLRAAAGVVWPRAARRLEVGVPAPRTYDLVLIGCSTGGPAALQHIVPALPANSSLPVVIAQHIPGTFTGPMAQRLGQLGKVKVVEAQDGMPLTGGVVYIAPGGLHTVVRKDRLRCYLQVLPAEHVATPFRPSVDVLFKSAEEYGSSVLAVILTGMGQDGLEGAKVLHRAGAHILAESEESAIIYGMPRAVAEANLAHGVLSLRQITEFLQKAMQR